MIVTNQMPRPVIIVKSLGFFIESSIFKELTSPSYIKTATPKNNGRPESLKYSMSPSPLFCLISSNDIAKMITRFTHKIANPNTEKYERCLIPRNIQIGMSAIRATILGMYSFMK